MNLFTILKKILRKVFSWLKFAPVCLYFPIAIILYYAKFRFVDGNLYSRIGHLSLEPDCYIKAHLLGWHSKYHCILFCQRDKVVNPVLFDYWKAHFIVISNAFVCYLLYPLFITPFLRIYIGRDSYIGKDRNSRVFPAVYSIARAYDKAYGAKPLLGLPAADKDKGWSYLNSFGVAKDSWFVCLHVREAGYLPHLNYHSYRDADISSYIPAIKSVVDRGGWVVRIGDSTMTPLPDLDRVIDLTQSNSLYKGIDIFCLTQCKFVIGTTSGPVAVSYIFGVPTVLTNWVPMGHGGYSKRDTWIPKLYWSEAEGRYLSFKEILTTPLRSYGQTEQFEKDGISVVDNSPEEIREVCLEVMDRVDSRFSSTQEDEELQGRFHSLLEVESTDWSTDARVGRDFLRRHRALFDVIEEK